MDVQQINYSTICNIISRNVTIFVSSDIRYSCNITPQILFWTGAAWLLIQLFERYSGRVTTLNAYQKIERNHSGAAVYMFRRTCYRAQ